MSRVEKRIGPRIDLSVILKEGADMRQVASQVRGRRRMEYTRPYKEVIEDPILFNSYIVRVYPRSAEAILTALNSHEDVDSAQRSGERYLAMM